MTAWCLMVFSSGWGVDQISFFRKWSLDHLHRVWASAGLFYQGLQPSDEPWDERSPVRQNVWSMCLDLHHIWPASTEGHTNTWQMIIRNKYRPAPSIYHVTWICTLTAVRNFLSLTPTPPHPHIHLSNITPPATRKRPGSRALLEKVRPSQKPSVGCINHTDQLTSLCFLFFPALLP